MCFFFLNSIRISNKYVSQRKFISENDGVIVGVHGNNCVGVGVDGNDGVRVRVVGDDGVEWE